MIESNRDTSMVTFRPSRRAMLRLSIAAAATTTVSMAGAVDAAAAARGRRFFVAPDGDDANPGTLTAPLATPEGARDAVRRWRRTTRSGTRAPVTVYFRGGVYRLTRSFVLGAEDSGSPGRPVIYTAHAGEDVRFVGGADLAGDAFVPVTDPAVRDRLPESARDHVLEFDLAAVGVTDYGQIVQSGFGLPAVVAAPELFVNGVAMTLARYPNEGFLRIGEVVDPGGHPRAVVGDDEEVAEELAKGATFTYSDRRPDRWLNTGDLWMYGYWYHDWADGNLQIAAIDTAAGTLSTTTASWYSVRANQRYYYTNVLEELDAPGEWYLDRESGKLYLYPPQPIAGTAVQLSLLDAPMMIMDGTSNLVISGLTFEACRSDGIHIINGQNNTVEGCTLRLLGGRAVRIGDESAMDGPSGGTGNVVRACHIHGTGTGGITLGGGDRIRLKPANNRATGNEIHDYSRLQATYSPAVQLAGVGNRADHNDIYDAPHVAVQFSGNDHLIEFNRIGDVVKETNDAGAIYAGRDWTCRGTVIRHNFLYDILGSGGSFSAAGVYLDDAYSGTTVFGNIFYNVNLAMLLGGGRDNNVANNVILSCARSMQLDARGLGWAAEEIAPGGGWGMYDKLAAVPYQDEPWRSSYSNLATIVDEDPAVPKYNTVETNALFDVSDLDIAAEARDHGTVENNLTLAQDPGVVQIVDGVPELRHDDRIAEQLPGYQSIPINEIGPPDVTRRDR